MHSKVYYLERTEDRGYSSPSARMRVSIPNFAPIQPLKVEIVRLEFAFERLEMEHRYLRLEEIADMAESNAKR